MLGYAFVEGNNIKPRREMRLYCFSGWDLIRQKANKFGIALDLFVSLHHSRNDIGNVKDKATISVHASELPASVSHDIFYMPLYYSHAVPVAVYR